MSSEAIDIKSILDDIVHQFADPLAFFRELVQNSIDAGTGEIEIDLKHDPGTKMLEISVADWGEGMNREIIETKLTRLFSSGKDDDLTKIGRFGIGFVSVFAIAPETVVVDTGRDGQFWRLIFGADRTFELYALEQPVEGTLVRIYKPMEVAEFETLKVDVHRVIVTWCKHASVPIYFLGEDVREPFDIDSTCKITHEEQGTRIVMGYVEPFTAPVGYYNRGLTLRENPRGPWPHVSYKIDSRYLEHTLTRDQIIEDGHFEKAYGILRRMATTVLPERLVETLETLSHDVDSARVYEGHARYLANYLKADHRVKRPWRRKRLLMQANGEVTSFHEVQRAMRRGTVYLVAESGPLCEAVPKDVILLRGTQHDGVGALLQEALGRRPPQLEEHFYLLDLSRGGDGLEIRDMMTRLLGEIGLEAGPILFDDLTRLGPRASALLGFVVDKDLEIVDLHAAAQAPSFRQITPSKALVIHRGAAIIDDLIRLEEREPEWAAMTMLKVLLGSDPGSIAMQDALVRAAVEARSERLR